MSGKTVAVVGGGISGISAAVTLARRGHRPLLLDAGDVLGGRVGVAHLGDRQIMMGGKNIGHRYTHLRSLLTELDGGTFQDFGINTSTVRGGRLLPLDSSRPFASVRSLLRMGTPRDLLRLGRLARTVRHHEQARFLGAPQFRRLAERYDDPALTGYFSPRMTSSLLRLATVRMNGAEPEEAHLGNLGTNLGLLTDTFEQLDHGLGPALARVPELVDVRLTSRVTGLRPHATGVDVQWNASSSSSSAVTTHTQHVDGAVLALPAHAAAPLLAPPQPGLAGLLATVRYFPATVVVARYASDVFAPDVRAVTMGDGACSNAGAYGTRDLDLVRYTFSGRRERLEDPAPDEVDRLLVDAEARLAEALDRPMPQRLDRTWRHWPAAYCAYTRHHARLLDRIAEQAQPLSGRIALAGDYVLGASLEACCRSGAAAVEPF